MFSDELRSDRHAGCGTIHGLSYSPPPTNPEAPLSSAETQHSLQLHKQVVFPEISSTMEWGVGMDLLGSRIWGPLSDLGSSYKAKHQSLSTPNTATH